MFQAMVGMYHDGGIRTRMTNNRAAGSERSGFSGPGAPCTVGSDWLGGNVAHSSLAGYWFDHYNTKGSCVLLRGFTAWMIWEYGVCVFMYVCMYACARRMYGEGLTAAYMNV